MNRKVECLQERTIIDYISTLKEELSEMDIPEEKMREIKKNFSSNNDYHSLQAIIDILGSMPKNERVYRLYNKFHF